MNVEELFVDKYLGLEYRVGELNKQVMELTKKLKDANARCELFEDILLSFKPTINESSTNKGSKYIYFSNDYVSDSNEYYGILSQLITEETETPDQEVNE